MIITKSTRPDRQPEAFKFDLRGGGAESRRSVPAKTDPAGASQNQHDAYALDGLVATTPEPLRAQSRGRVRPASPFPLATSRSAPPITGRARQGRLRTSLLTLANSLGFAVALAFIFWLLALARFVIEKAGL